MKKIWKSVFLTILAAMLFVVPSIAQAEPQDYWAYVYKWDGKMNTDGTPVLTRLTSGVTFKVLAVGADTAETITEYGESTSLTNPVTTTNFASNTVCNDMVAFRTDPTDSTSDRYVDLIVVDTNGGYTTFVEDFDKYNHTIIIDERPNILHHGMIWFGASDNASVDTGVDFLKDTAIMDVIVEIVTVDNTETLNVGTADTAAGFISAISLATASEGYKTDTGFITGGSTIDYVPATQYGTLLTTAITGSDAVATVGGNTRKWHFVTTTGTDDDLTYIGTAGSDTAAGYIHYFFMRLR
jgi:hypothetical protein